MIVLNLIQITYMRSRKIAAVVEPDICLDHFPDTGIQIDHLSPPEILPHP